MAANELDNRKMTAKIWWALAVTGVEMVVMFGLVVHHLIGSIATGMVVE